MEKDRKEVCDNISEKIETIHLGAVADITLVLLDRTKKDSYYLVCLGIVMLLLSANLVRNDVSVVFNLINIVRNDVSVVFNLINIILSIVVIVVNIRKHLEARKLFSMAKKDKENYDKLIEEIQEELNSGKTKTAE